MSNPVSRKRDASHLTSPAATPAEQDTNPASLKRARLSPKEGAKVGAAFSEAAASASNSGSLSGQGQQLQAQAVESIHTLEDEFGFPVQTLNTLPQEHTPLVPAPLTAPIFSLTRSDEGVSIAGSSETVGVSMSGNSAVMPTAHAAARTLGSPILGLQTPEASSSSHSHSGQGRPAAQPPFVPMLNSLSLLTPNAGKISPPLCFTPQRESSNYLGLLTPCASLSLTRDFSTASSSEGAVMSYEAQGNEKLENGRYGEAIRFYELGLNSRANQGDEPAAKEKRASFQNQIGLALLQDLGRALLRGDDLEHFRKNHPYADFTSAIKNFQRALHLNCQNHSLNLHIRFHLAMALYFRAEMGDRAYAIQVLREAVDSMEGKALSGEEQIFMARLLREFGVILENENSKDEMLSCFENAADLCRQMQTEDPARYNLFARALVDLGIHLMDSDSQKALQYLEEASGVQAKVLNKKTLADLYLNLGLMYEKGGDLNQAFAAFEKASSLDFQDRDLYAQIAFNFARFAAGFKNDLDLSIGVLERALKLEIKDDALAADLHWLMMSHLFKRGRPADVLAAIARGQTALDLPFQNGAIRTKLLLLQAFLYQLVNNKKEAATHYKLAATIEGNTPQVKVLCNVNAANLLDELEMFKAAIKCLKAALADVDACENPVFKAKLCRALAIMYFKLSASIEDNESSIEIAKEGRGYLLMGLKVEHNDQTVKDLLFERLGFYFFGEQGIEDFGTDEERINAGRLLFSGSDMARAEALRLVLPILIEKKKDFAAAIRAVLQARSLVDQAAQAEQAHSQFLASLAYLAARANLELFKKEREQEQFEAARKELEKGFSLAQGLAQQAQFLTLQSQLFEEAKDFATAETLLKQACELWKTKDRLGLELLNHRARFMMRRAEDALHVQNSQEAIQKAKDAIELAGDQDLQLALIRRLGAIYLVTKKYDLALNLFLGEINANRGGPIHLAEVRVSYAGALHLSRGDLQVAYQYLKEADTLLGPNPEQLGERAITVKAAVNRIRSILDEEFARMQQPAEQQPLESDSVV